MQAKSLELEPAALCPCEASVAKLVPRGGGREINGQGLDGDVEIVDSESGERLRVSIGERERIQYRETMLRLTREIKSFCFKRGLHYSLFTTDADFQQFFLRAASDLGLAH